MSLRLPKQIKPADIAVATVRWAKDQFFGLAFTELSPAAQNRLKKYVADRFNDCRVASRPLSSCLPTGIDPSTLGYCYGCLGRCAVGSESGAHHLRRTCKLMCWLSACNSEVLAAERAWLGVGTRYVLVGGVKVMSSGMA